MVPLKLCPGPGGKTRSSSYYLTSQLNLNIDLLKQLIYFFVKIFLLYRASVFFILLHARTHARTHTVAEVEASRHRALEDKASIDRCANESFSRAALITLTPTFPAVCLAERLHTSSFHAHSIHILRSPLSVCVREPFLLPLWLPPLTVHTHRLLQCKEKKKLFKFAVFFCF